MNLGQLIFTSRVYECIAWGMNMSQHQTSDCCASIGTNFSHNLTLELAL